MAKVSTNINLDVELKRKAQVLFAEFGMDLTTAVTVFLSQAVREQKIPFEIRREIPNETTKRALAEYQEMKNDSKKYKRYDSFEEALKEKL